VNAGIGVSLLVTALVTFVSALGTGLVRRYALARAILDIPNDRSSHDVPTPRGGGLAIAVAAVGGIVAAAAIGQIDARMTLALTGGGLLVAGIGWIDDHRHVAARWRGLVHLVAAVWAVSLVGGLDSLRIGGGELPLGLAGSVLAVIGIVWLVNLYNFMDGIDGIAGGEALVVGSIGAILSLHSGAPSVGTAALITAAAAAGFLAWNWPPAKIFMGDVGSGLLGYLFGVLAVASERSGGPPLLTWAILLGVFIVDATLTLLRRVLKGEQWYSAHRSHAYQRAVQAGRSHRAVSSNVLLINLLLGCAALISVERPALLPWMVGAAFLLLLAVYLLVERERPMFLPYANGRIPGL
jgi:Fuc2NAc and GlcNAc transferase